MALTLQAIHGSTTVSLTDGAPFSLLGAKGMGGVPVRRVTARGPMQHGDTDIGYRLGPREMELEIGFHATTDAILDDYRDTLNSVFAPRSATPVKLKATRDDSGIRQIDCYRVGEVGIDLVPQHRPGHYHRATVRLRAPDPAWYDPVPGTRTVTGASAGTASDWYLAGSAIPGTQVLMSGSAPAQGSVWSYSGTVTDSYTLAFRSPYEAAGTATKAAFHVDNTGASDRDPSLSVTTAGVYWQGNLAGAGASLGAGFMSAGTGNYFLRYDPDGNLPDSQKGLFEYPGGTVSLNIPDGETMSISGTARRWRSNSTNVASSRWSSALLLYALYSPGLTDDQIRALDTEMAGAVGGTVQTRLSIGNYLGDMPEYPVISVTGPIANLRIDNAASDSTIIFGTVPIAGGETYVLDLRPGRKTVTLGTVNKRDMLSASSDWDTWHITPNTVQGINPIYVYGTGAGTATSIQIVYYTRYSSF